MCMCMWVNVDWDVNIENVVVVKKKNVKMNLVNLL